MEVRGTEGADTYDQQTLGVTDWLDYYGLGGDDTIRMYKGQTIPGPGNDRVEKIASTQYGGPLAIALWDAPKGVVVDLAAGTADDGWGTHDTLVNVDNINCGGQDDRLYGSNTDNHFSPGGGRDLVDGRGGLDSIVLPWLGGSPATLDKIKVSVSIDGRTASITSAAQSNFRLDLVDVERFQLDWGKEWFNLADFIDPKAVAQQGLTGADTQRWNAAAALGSAVTVSYSFVSASPSSGMGASGFRSFTEAEKLSVREILGRTSQVSGISFQEVAESGAALGQLRFGVSQQAQTKGVAYMPDVSAANTSAGDVWMDADSMLMLAPGSEGYAALLHEIGHALGLRHPRNVDAGDAWAQQMRAADDRSSQTVMSGTASPDGLFRADWGVLDIAALQYLYGAKSVNSGDNSYQVGGPESQAQRSLVDSGGSDTLDASTSQVGVSIDLLPAHLSSVGLTAQGLAPVENLGIAIDSLIENAIGSANDDVLLGNAINNRLTGGLGNDWLDGLAGTDVAVFAAARADYVVSAGFGKVFVVASDGISGFDTLQNIERLSFSDRGVALDVAATQAGGGAALLIGAVLGEAALTAKKPLVGAVIDLFDQGFTLQVLSGAVMRLPIWGLLAGNGAATASNIEIANYLLTTVNRAAPDAAALNAAVKALDAETGAAQGSFLWHLAESSANQVQVGLVGLAASGLEFGG